MPHTISSSKPPDAAKIAVLFPTNMPTDPAIAITAITRIDCCLRADGGRFRVIHRARKT